MQRLQEGGGGKTNLAMTTICWLFFARRHLSPGQLLHALALSGDNPQVGKHTPEISDVLDSCAGLVVLTGKYDVGFFHKTFDDYLTKHHSSWFPQGNRTIGTICMNYISLRDTGSRAQDPEAIFEPMYRSSLYRYASAYWHYHVRGTVLETTDMVMAILTDASKLSASMDALDCVPKSTVIHFTVLTSLDNALRRCLELYVSQVNAKDGSGRTALFYATQKKNFEAANCLIEAGADPNIKDNWEQTAWAHAIENEDFEAASYLTEAGADPNVKDQSGMTQLSNAVYKDNLALATYLLEVGADSSI